LGELNRAAGFCKPESLPGAEPCRAVLMGKLFERTAVLAIVLFASAGVLAAAEVSVDLALYRADCGVAVTKEGDRLTLRWPMAQDAADAGEIVLDLRPGQPLFDSVGIASRSGAAARPVLRKADPVTFLLVGSREAPENRPPGMSEFNVFFDSPARRPFQSFRSQLDLKRAKVASQGQRVTVGIGDISIGPFTGELRLTVYRGARLVHAEMVVHSDLDRRAILYDAGLALEGRADARFAWVDTDGTLKRESSLADTRDRHLAVSHRALLLATGAGSLACFPPPHQFFFPRDSTENLKTVWYGRDHRNLDSRFGFGIRQAERGGGSFVPWFNAPPGTDQRLGVFYLLSSGSAERALAETLRYTHGDRFAKVPGHHTFTSHWHMAVAMAALKERQRRAARPKPDFVRMFKEMGVEMVHLAEFHGDGHPQDPGPDRLLEMQAMFDECRRLSDSELLLLPGEEANVYLGLPGPGKHAGHWMYLFTRPVYWTMNRAPEDPFLEDLPPYGKVYHVGGRNDMLRLIESENGLAWTAHPRIKASSWTPDIFRREDFYLSDHWLGAAWKAMPADLSHDRLGRRALDLLDDMANWGQKKYLPAEVDVFKLDHTHELYGHMNINYLRLDPDRLPRFDDGWQPVVDALRGGRFFATTGEVLIPVFSINGQPGGSDITLKPSERPEVRIELSWTFPLRFVEMISGDGSHVFRQRIDCPDAGPFGQRTIRLTPDLSGCKWVRAEAWDIAANGAYTQPVWLTAAPSSQ
jgi:hypothetical protein